MRMEGLRHLERNVHRGGQIIGVLAKYGLADWVKGLNCSWVQDRIKSFDGQPIPDLKIEERLRLAFTELGTTFIKLGQMLSTCPLQSGVNALRDGVTFEFRHRRDDREDGLPERTAGVNVLVVVGERNTQAPQFVQRQDRLVHGTSGKAHIVRTTHHCAESRLAIRPWLTEK